MRKTIQLTIGCILAVFLMVAVCETEISATAAQSTILLASVQIMGAPGSGISGDATLTQKETGNLPVVEVKVKVKGLAPKTVHGMHFHEKGLCDPPGFITAGGHYDPGPFSMSSPDVNHPFHMGDLPNLIANAKGIAKLNTVTNRITLSQGPLTLFDADGTVLIVHANPDLGIPGAAGSGTAGGPRIACGIVKMAK